MRTSYFHSCALLFGGSLKCWGSNSYGNLGSGESQNSAVPVFVNFGGKYGERGAVVAKGNNLEEGNGKQKVAVTIPTLTRGSGVNLPFGNSERTVSSCLTGKRDKRNSIGVDLSDVARWLTPPSMP